jgi:two-component system chemotaxis sensor kinase CheA
LAVNGRFPIQHSLITIYYSSVDQPRKFFLAETEDLIEQVFAGLDGLRQEHNRQRQRQLIDEIFRQVHRIKGSGATFGFDGLSEIAHELENLLSALRADEVPLSDNALDAAENATTALSESLRLAAAGVIEPSRRELFDSLRALTYASGPEAVGVNPVLSAVLTKLPADLSQALTDQEKRRLARRLAEGNCLCVVATSFDIASFDDQFYRVKERLSESGEVISTSPSVDPQHPETINFRILFSTAASGSDVQSGLSTFPNLSVTEVPLSSPSQESSSKESRQERKPSASRSNFIRTDLDDLDRLISSTHELYRLTTRTLELAQNTIPRADGQTFDQLARQIRQSFLSVEGELISLRMVSLGPTLQRAARAGRAAARLNEKLVDFEVVGFDLRLDKLLCDAIADPLVHLVRNAVDHGIETPDARFAAGKPERGKVVIEAAKVGGKTRVRVSDDGRGVDPEAVSRAARRLGIIEKTSLEMSRALRLIFRPGFSTVLETSTVSGRGVGLDIVETEVELVGGEVRVSSEPGKLTIFELRLPGTFSLLNSTVVKAGDNRFCVDTDQIVKSQQVNPAEIEINSAGESIRSEAGVLPLVRLRKVLGVAGSPKPQAELSVITCELPLRLRHETGELIETRNGKRLIGLVVDGVTGTEEVLVRNLGRHAGRWYGVAGAAELRDGTVALVLDLPRLLARSG